MKKSRLEKIPVPISLSKRNLKVHLDLNVPYRIEAGSLSSRSIQENKKTNMEDMKQELSLIKEDFQKIITTAASTKSIIITSNRKQLDLLMTPTKQSKTIQDSSSSYILEIKKLKQKLAQYQQSSKKDTKAQKIQKHRLKQLNESLNDAIRNKDKIIQKYEKEIQYLNKNQDQLKVIAEMEEEIYSLKKQLEHAAENLNISELKRSKLQIILTNNEVTISQNNLDIEALRLQISELQNAMNIQKKKFTSEFASVEKIYQIQRQQSHAQRQKVEITCSQLKESNTKISNELRTITMKLETAERKNQQSIVSIRSMQTQLQQLFHQNQELRMLNQKLRECQTANEIKLKQFQISMDQNQNKNNQNFYNQLNSLKQQLHDLDQKNKYLLVVISEKEAYIEALEDQPASHLNDFSKELECKYKKTIDRLQQQKSQLINNYERALRDRTIQQENITNKKSIIHRGQNFDEVLKQQIKEKDELRKILRNKNEQIYQLKLEIEEGRRFADCLRNELQIDRLKMLTEIKGLKSNYQSNAQVYRNETDGLKRKLELTERKYLSKINEIKSKDEFIQNVLIKKVNDNSKQSEIEFIKSQLQRFATKCSKCSSELANLDLQN